MFRKLLIVTAILSMIYACGGNEDKQDTGVKPRNVKVAVYRVAPVSADSVRTFTANISSENTAVITPKVQGYIEQILVVPGQHVVRGQLLVVIKSDELKDRAMAANAGQMQAENGLTQARTGYGMAQAQLGQAQAQYDLASKTYTRYSNLMSSNSVSKQEFDEVASKYQAAAQGLKIARDNVTLASQKIQQQQYQKGQASAMKSEAGTYLSYTQLRAPFDGVVLEKDADTGSFAAPGTPVLKVGSNAPVVYTYVSQNMLKDIKAGTNAVISVDSLNKDFTSKVTEISPDVDTMSGNFKVKLSAPAGLVNGMFAKVHFSTGTEEVIAVPKSAVVQRGQLSIVFADEHGRADMRVIKTGRDFGDTIEIVSGLSAGDKVVTGNPVALRSGDIIEAE